MILETLYILFKYNSSDLKKGSEEAITSIKKVKSSIEDINYASDKVKNNFSAIGRSISGIVTSYLSVHAILSSLSESLNYDIELGKNSRLLGVNSQELEQWEGVVRHAGGTAQDFDSSLKSLAENLNTTPAVAIKYLPKLADIFHSLSRFTAIKLGKSIGLDENFILLLQHGRRELEEYLKHQKELGLVSKENIEITTNYYKSLDDLHNSVITLGNSILSETLPYISKFFNLLVISFEYLSKHSSFILSFLGSLAAGALAAGVAFIPLFGEIMLIVGALLLLSGTVGLVFDDLYNYFKGNKSLTGNIADKIQSFKDIDKETGKSDSIEWLREKYKNLLGNDDFSKDENFYSNLDSAKSFFNIADQSPLNSLTSNSISNSSAFSRNTNINTGPITIQTEAQDAEGISQGLGKYLNYHLQQSANNFADNVYA